MLRRILSQVFNYDSAYRTRTVRRVARRVPRYESSEYDADRMFEEWTEESFPELDDASYAQRLEEEERNQGSRTTRLPEQHEGVGRKHQEIPDPWD
jgi:hypothetical protein